MLCMNKMCQVTRCLGTTRAVETCRVCPHLQDSLLRKAAQRAGPLTLSEMPEVTDLMGNQSAASSKYVSQGLQSTRSPLPAHQPSPG